MGYLTDGAIDVTALLAEVAGAERGGTVLFLGSVRRGDEDGSVVAIDYTAYEEMAGRECGRILAEARDRWPQVHVTLRHRIGPVPTGEPSVAVVAAAPHRAEAFDACRFTIDALKRRLPIWKKERFADGTARWREDVHAGRPRT